MNDEIRELSFKLMTYEDQAQPSEHIKRLLPAIPTDEPSKKPKKDRILTLFNNTLSQLFQIYPNYPPSKRESPKVETTAFIISQMDLKQMKLESSPMIQKGDFSIY